MEYDSTNFRKNSSRTRVFSKQIFCVLLEE